jgi:hypothetical protein
MNIELLNKVQSHLIEQATAAGILLSDEFSTTEEFKRFVIGAAFKGLRDAGASVQVAYDAVIGEGAYENLAGDVYDKHTA